MVRLRIGLIGWGTVGSAFGRLVNAGPLPLELACVAVRDSARTRAIPLPEGVALVTPEDVSAARIDAVVELTDRKSTRLNSSHTT
jgi:predicted dinucleotide-utilizing enzyme